MGTNVTKDILATVIVLAEKSPVDTIHQNLSNIFAQTHKNLDVIVSCVEGNDVSSLIAKWEHTTFNITWLTSKQGLELISSPIKSALGEYIFYKSMNSIVWYPRHIEHHLELFTYDKRKSLWSFSHIEYKNLQEQGQMLNSMGWRISNTPVKEQIIIDELVHHISVKPEWDKCIAIINGQQAFVPGLIVDQFKKFKVIEPKEITVVQWTSQQQPQQIQLGVPVSLNNVDEKVEDIDGELKVRVEYPTLVGNIQFAQHNATVRDRMKLLNPLDVKKIAIKRTIGMGDVILVEPVIRALKIKYPNASITMYAGDGRGASEIVKNFDSKVDTIIPIPEVTLAQDHLYSQKGFDLRFDFDLAYESRKNVKYIDAYFETAGFEERIEDVNGELQVIKFVNDAEKVQRLVYDKEAIIKEKYVAVELAGSGWQGKEWDVEKWNKILTNIREHGIKIAYVSTYRMGIKGDYVNEKNDFDTMLNYLKYCDFYIGSDCGPMHVATGFGKKCFVICGAAMSHMTSYSKKIYEVANRNLTCLHCKGRNFYNQTETGQITFVSKCDNLDLYACMKKLEADYVLQEFHKFLS